MPLKKDPQCFTDSDISLESIENDSSEQYDKAELHESEIQLKVDDFRSPRFGNEDHLTSADTKIDSTKEERRASTLEHEISVNDLSLE